MVTFYIIWKIFKIALMGIIVPLIGMYVMMRGLLSYVKEAYQKLKELRPNVKPKGGGAITGLKLSKVVMNAQNVILDSVELSESDKEKAKKDLKEIETNISNGKIDGVHYIDGVNEQGEDDILDACFFKSQQMAENDKNRNLYRPFTNSH